MQTQQEATTTGAATTSEGAVDPGGSLTSFDELEAVESSRSEQVKAKGEEAAEIEKAKQEALGEDKDAGISEENKVEAKPEEEVGEPDLDAKIFKALSGEDEIEIRGDALLKLKVDGEEVEMTVEDVINGTSGQEAIKKRFGELGAQNKELINEKTKWTQEKSYFDQRLKTALQLLNDDPLAGFASFVEMSGMDSAKWLDAFLPKMTEQFQSLADMTEGERKQYEQSVLTQQREARLTAKEAEINTQHQHQQVLRQVNELKAKFEIDDDVFKEKFLELEQLQKNGKIAGEITPDFVADVVRYDRTEAKIKAVAEVVRPSLLQDRNAMGDLTEILLNQDPKGDFTEDDIKDIVIQAFPETSGVEDSLSKKVRKSGKASGTNSAKEEAADPQNDPVSFEDL